MDKEAIMLNIQKKENTNQDSSIIQLSKQKEWLSPNLLEEQVNKRIAELIQIQKEAVLMLRNSPEGRVRFSRRCNRHFCFYEVDSDKSHGEYIPVSQQALVKKLVQKDYWERVGKAAQKQLQLLRKFSRHFFPDAVDSVYQKMHEARRAFVNPVRLPDDEFAARWLSETFSGKPFDDDSQELLTSSGIRVRSKSEVIIAETLDRLKIPFKYECPMKVKGFGQVYPDFTCLNVRARKIFVWEHFGMMDDADYALKAAKKIAEYRNSGLYLGINFMVSFETQSCPFTARAARQMAELYLR